MLLSNKNCIFLNKLCIIIFSGTKVIRDAKVDLQRPVDMETGKYLVIVVNKDPIEVFKTPGLYYMLLTWKFFII